MAALATRPTPTRTPSRTRDRSVTGGRQRPRLTSAAPSQDSTAPRQLTDRDRNYVFSVAMKYVKDEDAAADVTQDALLLAHRHRDSFRGDSRFTTWLYRIAATTALMYLRKQRRRGREVLVAPGDRDHGQSFLEYPSPRSTPEETGAAREALTLARTRLDEMGAKYREIFWLRFLEGYTETEIAQQLNLNVATVKTRAYRAKLAVRETLQTAMAS